MNGPVLIVDDDQDVREALAELLRAYGYTVLTAASGAGALRLLRGDGPSPAVIVLDLMMPGMDGWEFRALTLQDPDLARIPVVVVSGALKTYPPPPPVNEAITKPVDPQRFLTSIARYC